MTSIVATGEVFHGRVKELHVAPEGLVLTSGGRVVNGDIESNYADYTEIDTATSGGDKASWLRITFNDNRPAWQVSGMQIQQAEWAEQMVNEAALAAQQRDDPIYRQKVALDTLGQHLSAFGDPAAPQVAPFIDLLLVQAILHGASDVHIDPIANQLLVRYRIDGALTDICELPISMRERLIGRLKVVGGMITYRSDVPQEGRSTAAIDDRDIDARIS
ncbi:MAG TPA: ATPase, T2SS/T4P/T4SS family, partial [Armatimonadota bacterium]|nr:ATPase, T2SS/T4P/T4SS family [Armatimonadota bacterium]